MLKTRRFIAVLFITAVSLSPAGADQTLQSLLDIYQKALVSDPVLSSAIHANRAAQEVIEQSKAQYRPLLQFVAAAKYSSTDITFRGEGSPFNDQGKQDFGEYQYQLELRQPIYRQQNLVRIDQSKIQVSQADKQLNLVQQRLILRVGEVYFAALLAQDKIDLIRSQKSAIQGHLKQAQANFAVGNATINDINDAKARFDLVVAQEIRAINEHQIALRVIQNIIGEMPHKLASVKNDFQVPALSSSLENWIDIALQNNLMIQIQGDTAKLSDQAIELANAGHLPTLDVVAKYQDSQSNGGSYGYGSSLSDASIGLQLEVPLYQGGAVSSRIRQAQHNKYKAMDDMDISKRQVEQEIQTAYLNLQNNVAQLEALAQALKSSQGQLDSTSVGLEVGTRTSIDLLNVEQQMYSVKRDMLQADYDYLLNLLRLKTAAGVVGEADIQDINQQLIENTSKSKQPVFYQLHMKAQPYLCWKAVLTYQLKFEQCNSRY